MPASRPPGDRPQPWHGMQNPKFCVKVNRRKVRLFAVARIMTAVFVLLNDAQLAVKATLAALDVEQSICEKAMLSIAMSSFHCMWIPTPGVEGSSPAAAGSSPTSTWRPSLRHKAVQTSRVVYPQPRRCRVNGRASQTSPTSVNSQDQATTTDNVDCLSSGCEIETTTTLMATVGALVTSASCVEPELPYCAPIPLADGPSTIETTDAVCCMAAAATSDGVDPHLIDTQGIVGDLVTSASCVGPELLSCAPTPMAAGPTTIETTDAECCMAATSCLEVVPTCGPAGECAKESSEGGSFVEAVGNGCSQGEDLSFGDLTEEVAGDSEMDHFVEGEESCGGDLSGYDISINSSPVKKSKRNRRSHRKGRRKNDILQVDGGAGCSLVPYSNLDAKALSDHCREIFDTLQQFGEVAGHFPLELVNAAQILRNTISAVQHTSEDMPDELVDNIRIAAYLCVAKLRQANADFIESKTDNMENNGDTQRFRDDGRSNKFGVLESTSSEAAAYFEEFAWLGA